MGDGEHVLPAMKALCFDPLLSDPVIQVPGPFVVQIPRPFVWLLHPASRAFAVPLRPPPLLPPPRGVSSCPGPSLPPLSSVPLPPFPRNPGCSQPPPSTLDAHIFPSVSPP